MAAGERAPDSVREAARRRSAARAGRDWATADQLRAEIEAAGWRVIDSGTDFRLEPAHPPDAEVGGVLRYGRSDSVPSRLGEPPAGPATIVVALDGHEAADGGVGDLERALGAALRHAPAAVDAVVVADGLGAATEAELEAVIERLGPDAGVAIELVRTSASLGRAAALNVGIRRASGAVIIVLDPSVVATGDVVGPLAMVLEDSGVAIAGPFGLASTDLRRFEAVTASRGAEPAAAIAGYLMAFQRADASDRGPLDEHFRFYRNLDIWWSLVLRDAGEGQPPRAALVVPDLPLHRGQPRAWAATPPAERDRLSKRNFYRVLDRFRTRLELAVPPPDSTGASRSG